LVCAKTGFVIGAYLSRNAAAADLSGKPTGH
jgi:hypothetical protein